MTHPQDDPAPSPPAAHDPRHRHAMWYGTAVVAVLILIGLLQMLR